MKGKTHLAIGLAATTTVNNGFKGVILMLPFVILGSLIPDIDVEKKSLIKSSKMITLFVVIILAYLYFNENNKTAQLGIVATIIISLIYSRTKHRTLSHSLVGLAILMLPIYLISSLGMIWFALGYLSHLISDSLTKSGIPFFYPLSKNMIGLKICKADGLLDKILRLASIFLIIYSFI